MNGVYRSIRVKDKIQERFIWSVGQLDIQPDEQILEIGVGYGIATELICDKLTEGSGDAQ